MRRLEGEVEESTGLPVVRFQKREDFKDPDKLRLFWSNDPKNVHDEVRSRIGTDNGENVFYLGNGIPTPKGLDYKCGTCGKVVMEERYPLGTLGALTTVMVSNVCNGPDCDRRSSKLLQIPKELIRECILFMTIPYPDGIERRK